MTLISLKLNFGAGAPVIRQSVRGVARSILRHIHRVSYLNREFVIRLVPGDRGVHKVVEGSSPCFLLYVQNFAGLIRPRKAPGRSPGKAVGRFSPECVSSTPV